MIFITTHSFRVITSSFIIFICVINPQYSSARSSSTRSGRTNRNTSNASMCKKICSTTECQAEAQHYLSIMNTKANPCDDFYEFVCGNFIKKKVINDQSRTINIFSLAQTEVTQDIYNEVQKEINPNDLKSFNKAKIYYNNCMNESLIEEEGMKPLTDMLNSIGGWPVLLGKKWNESDFNWKKSIFKIKDEHFYVFFPIIAAIDIDNRNSSRQKISIKSANTMISRVFLLESSKDKLLRAYLNYMTNVSVILGANRTEAMSELKEVVDFEVKLYNIKTTPEELLNTKETDNDISIKELTEKHPSIPWLKLLNKIFKPYDIHINDTEIVYVVDPKFITNLEILIKNTPKRVLANYIAWDVISGVIFYMPKKLRNEMLEFSVIWEGTKSTATRETWCYSEIMEAFSVSLSAMYVKKYFDFKNKDTVMEVIRNIQNQIKKRLEEVDWMDNETRKFGLEKLEAMNVIIGYADELMDDQKVDDYYKDLEINPGLYLKSAYNVASFVEKQNYKALRQSFNLNFWILNRNVAYVNAYNILQKNTIVVPAGFLTSLYRSGRPNYINYGSIGSLIGHEIIHSFDNYGRKYDKNGNQKNWWKSSTERKFLRKINCIIDQYNNFTLPEVGLKVNGILTQGENIADNGGFKAAYHAYNEWANNNNISEPCLPSLNYTQRQMFWISAASNWCSKQTPELLRDMVASDEHSPEIARIIISFSNIKEFSQDFKCKFNTKMNPRKKCIIW